MADITAAGRSLYRAWENRDFEALEDCLADGFSFNDASRGLVVVGKAGVKDGYASWVTACPDSVAAATAGRRLRRHRRLRGGICGNEHRCVPLFSGYRAVGVAALVKHAPLRL
jgi:SnoaL-like domain